MVGPDSLADEVLRKPITGVFSPASKKPLCGVGVPFMDRIEGGVMLFLTDVRVTEGFVSEGVWAVEDLSGLTILRKEDWEEVDWDEDEDWDEEDEDWDEDDEDEDWEEEDSDDDW
jgi:hypothetical protein